ncbi:hypothetical protein [Yoonia sp. I 8.24]|uniref:hypothetical protein n=1 Tax=Yoonia sp. I 8.24 TaxID=1537229 RepID=UPI001EDD56AF|nr:hypothetical protein [Yoonia sp. I 8.24]MCG3269308.1 hypothetical protein [Yoonia sp. I 8.24]
MIWNIVDKRKRPYRWKEINAIIEDVAHDNSCQDTDIFYEENENAPAYDAKENISLHEAIMWAEAKTGKVTLYLYDKGCGTRLLANSSTFFRTADIGAS